MIILIFARMYAFHSTPRSIIALNDFSLLNLQTDKLSLYSKSRHSQTDWTVINTKAGEPKHNKSLKFIWLPVFLLFVIH